MNYRRRNVAGCPRFLGSKRQARLSCRWDSGSAWFMWGPRAGPRRL